MIGVLLIIKLEFSDLKQKDTQMNNGPSDLLWFFPLSEFNIEAMQQDLAISFLVLFAQCYSY